MAIKQYNVTGMTCAACSARVEKAVRGVPGVDSCAVSLLTNSMGVTGSASPEAVIAAVEKAGYGASEKGREARTDTGLEDRETPRLVRRLVSSALFLLALMYVSMGHGMWGWPLPKALSGNPLAMALTQLLLCGTVMIINGRFFVSGFRSMASRAPNMDALVALGSGVSFLWSVALTFMMTAAVQSGDHGRAHELLHGLYFESAAMILTLITVGKLLEARSKGRTTDALKSLMSLAPATAVIVTDEGEEEVPIEQVKLGDVFVLRPGASVPVDGIILEGSGAVDESSLTGESVPVDKQAGDKVSAATVNRSGYLKCQATRVGEDTTLSQIIKMVSDAAATKAPIAKTADRVSGIFVPVVIGIAVITTVIWLLVGQEPGYALARGISVLVISCPCALGLATPVAIMVGSGVGARNGILFKTAASLEETGRLRIAAIDKTGTITSGAPAVTDIVPAEGLTEQQLLRAAFSLERKSEHPLASAIVRYAEAQGAEAFEVTAFEALAGSGVRAEHNGATLLGGSVESVMKQLGTDSAALSEQALTLAEQGKTPMLFAENGRALGLIAVADEIRPDSRRAVGELKEMGIHVVMLTGDNERTARAVGALAGVDEVVAGVLPEGKESVVRRLSKQGRTAMIGDGINDAPALTRADVGIAVGAGTDVAIDAADVVLMKSSLLDAAAAVRLSRFVLRNIHENLFWAFFYNVIGIPLAAGAYIKLFGWELSPMFGAAAMSLSSFCVVTNALRLNLKNIRDPKRDKPPKDAVRGVLLTSGDGSAETKKTLRVKGMMCEHCVAAVTQALEGIDGVSASVSLEDKTASLTISRDVPDSELIAAVTEAGYKAKVIQR